MGSAFANNPVEAKDLFEKSKQKFSLKNVDLILDLETIDRKGNSKSKELAVTFGEFDQEKKVMVEILAPEKVKGTKILTTNYLNKKGVIQIYMPATGKIQKFKASNRNLKLMGSEIPIAQFSSVIDEDYNYTLLGEEKIKGFVCHKIKVEKTKAREYRIAYITTQEQHLIRVEKFDLRNKIISYTEMSDFINITNSKNNIYPKQIYVKNLRSGKSSSMTIKKLSYLKIAKPDKFEI
jgi:hypothetical protein